MSTPLLATKFYPPPPSPTLVSRARLCKQLDAGLHRKLTLISAPAGFGKTTLVSEWLATAEHSIAWLSLAEEESDVNRFLTYLLGALQSTRPALGAGLLDALHSPQPPPTTAILTALLNELAGLSDAQILVLDDYHLVDARAVDEALAFLLDHLPPHVHIVITTREDPNLPLARLRARGQLTEVRAADLRFTAAEATAFLNAAMGLNLDEDAVAALEARTEGWIAGLQLAAISMQDRANTGANNRSAFIESFTGSHRFVMDYLVEEVLNQQPPPIQRFLLYTSIFDRFCGSLCDAVMGDGETSDAATESTMPEGSAGTGQIYLEQLEQSNLFLIPLDNERRWYRYHHLFVDLLRQRFHQQQERASTTSEVNIATLHGRAAIWFEENALAIEALRHALAANDFERAAGLLERTWRAMDDARQSARWLDWVQKLPEELIHNRPVLSAGYGWALLERGAVDAADAHLQNAERWLERIGERSKQSQTAKAEMCVSDEEEFQTLPATIAAARTYHALTLGDLAGTKQYAKQTLDLLPADRHLRRGVPAVLLALAYWTDGELTLACRTFAEGMTSFRMAGNMLFTITGSYILADMKRVQGRLREAAQIHQQWLQLAADQGELVQRGTADIYTGLSELACEQGNLEVAAGYLQQSEELGAHAGLPRWRYRWCLAQARLMRAQGELGTALALLEEAEQAYLPGPVPDVRPISAMKAQLWIAQNRLVDAQMWADNAGLQCTDALGYLHEFEQLTLARLCIARYRKNQEAHLLADALDLLARLQDAAEVGGRMGNVIEILMLQALAHEAQDDLMQACKSLERALRLAEPEGYVRLFLDEGPPMSRLLAQAAAENLLPDYVAMLRATIGSAVQQVGTPAWQIPSVPAPGDHSPIESLIEPLSERELEVLQLIAQGLSNREISERLFLALSTVKGHNRNIFGKLQVQRRTEAVARARELGLL